MAASRKMFVNLPVRDLERSKAFFARLGFTFDPQFTDDNAACMVVSEEGFVMLLTEPFFKSFAGAGKQVVDASRQTEAIVALSCDSRAEVDQLVKTAVESGGAPARDPMDHGFMYAWSFYDPDGHHWEVLWMDPRHLQR